ncbi:MBL fold metallo-hydrolase [candidate division TA06 bacterium]|uniref:MBL fold metallo-hydrolase n=1 Tax=candidate division TA06 bacterium TaxID=2250710 RepID=A0A523XTZ4_UNCT6|nr:MAG: MBL fold metallo-hydrolase [candidate division TA06 bacterium]
MEEVPSETGRSTVNRVIFLGTGGARFVVFQQIRASGGMWMELDGTTLLVDPGPGSLVKMRTKKEKLDPRNLDAIVLSHAHLDHSADLNVVIEAMTEGGFKKKGQVLLPRQAMEEPGLVLDYLREYVNGFQVMVEGGTYQVGNVELETPIKHIHGLETYGINFRLEDLTLSYVSDSRYFEKLAEVYNGDVLILNVVRAKPSNLDHLCLDDAKAIISKVKPGLAVLTHFGMTVIKAKPWVLAEEMSRETGVKVVAARDGMILDLSEFTSKNKKP